MKKKKGLYLMHVEWGWIKQRPHFMAEHLAHHYELDVVYIKNLKNKNLVKNPIDSDIESIQAMYKVPFSSRNRGFLQKLEALINKRVFSKIHHKTYDFVWITSPIILQFLDISKINAKRFVYDCMDDILSFPHSLNARNTLEFLEKKLLNQVDTLIVSSRNLQKKMLERGYSKNAIHIINNATNFSSLSSMKYSNKDAYFNIVYFGTISEWFDFELILRILELQQDVKFTLIGPIEVTIPTHKRIKTIGPIVHDQLDCYCAAADAFIMPFKINELVLSVDPVKIYEYLRYTKPTFVIEYDETLKFSEFVELYIDSEDLSNKINLAKKNLLIKTNEIALKTFLNDNTWDKRAYAVAELLE